MPTLETIRFHNGQPLAGLTGVVDYDNAVIHGVSLITGDMMAEGHDLYVDSTTLSQLHALGKKMSQVPVTLDHGGGITSINGYIDNHRLDGNKVRGDWHLLKSHKETETMLERADRQPGTFGMSVAFKGPPKGVLHMGKKCARAEKLLSVDCVTRAAANPDGMFSAREVDNTKINMSKPAATANENEPTLADVMEAVQDFKTRLEGFEGIQNQIVEHINQTVEGQDEGNADPYEVLSQLYNSTDEELQAQGITRAEVDAAVNEYNASVEAGGGEGGGEAAGELAGGEAAGGELAGAGAGAVAGGAAGVTPATFKALVKDVINLKAEIAATKMRAVNDAEEIQMSEVAGKITILADQRDKAIELAESLVSENEALRLANRTGTRPVRPGIDHGVRLFSANGDGELHQFQKLVKEIQGKKDGRTEGEAILLAMKEPNGPALHADWLQTQSAPTIHA